MYMHVWAEIIFIRVRILSCPMMALSPLAVKSSRNLQGGEGCKDTCQMPAGTLSMISFGVVRSSFCCAPKPTGWPHLTQSTCTARGPSRREALSANRARQPSPGRLLWMAFGRAGIQGAGSDFYFCPTRPREKRQECLLVIATRPCAG